MSTLPALGPLAEWVAGLADEPLPQGVAQRLSCALLDWSGAALAGTTHDLAVPYRAVQLDLLGSGGAGPSRMLGSKSGWPLVSAAAFNAAAGHFLDIDDADRASTSHPGITVIPVVLAMAQARPVSPARWRAAMLAGYEGTIRVGSALGKAHYAVSHSTATAGCFGAAAAAAVMLELDAGKTLAAFGHAGTQAAGLWQFLDDGAEDAKAFHPANAVRNGMTAALMAAHGVPSARAVIEGRRGMLAAWGIAADGLTSLSDALGQSYALDSVTTKNWPVCGQMHSVLDAASDLATQLAPQDTIDRVIVHGPRALLDVAGTRNPTTIATAKFSTTFCTAATLMKMPLDFSGNWASLLDRADVRELADRIELVEDPDHTARFPRERPCRVEILTRSGRVIAVERSFRRGDPEAPLQWGDLVSRFHATTQLSVPDRAKRDAVVAWCGSAGDEAVDITAAPLFAASYQSHVR